MCYIGEVRVDASCLNGQMRALVGEGKTDVNVWSEKCIIHIMRACIYVCRRFGMDG